MDKSVRIVAALTFGIASPVSAASRFQVTPAERSACGKDATDLCYGALPDEDAVVECMKVNVAKLTAECRSVFEAGLRRRGLR